LQFSSIYASWQRAQWLSWQQLGNWHSAVELNGNECPQHVGKEPLFEVKIHFFWRIEPHN
jgi:hypothetical protein